MHLIVERVQPVGFAFVATNHLLLQSVCHSLALLAVTIRPAFVVIAVLAHAELTDRHISLAVFKPDAVA